MGITPFANWGPMNEMHRPAAPRIAHAVSPHPVHGERCPRRVAGAVNIVSTGGGDA